MLRRNKFETRDIRRLCGHLIQAYKESGGWIKPDEIVAAMFATGPSEGGCWTYDVIVRGKLSSGEPVYFGLRHERAWMDVYDPKSAQRRCPRKIHRRLPGIWIQPRSSKVVLRYRATKRTRDQRNHWRSLEENIFMSLNFFDSNGMPFAYSDNGETIYTFDGRPVAYLYDESLYAFSGLHRGFFEDGQIWDSAGSVVLFTPVAYGGPMKPLKSALPLKVFRQLAPFKALRNVRPPRPFKNKSWSSTLPENHFT